MNNSNDSNIKEKVNDHRRSIQALFQDDYSDSYSDSSSNDIHESSSDISINSDYNEN